ncbi:unnamed protein product, partial [Iphiclides podalirius]
MFKNKITSKGLATAVQLKEIDIRIRKEMDEIVKRIKTDTEAEPEELTADIYYSNLHPFIRGTQPNQLLKHANLRLRK